MPLAICLVQAITVDGSFLTLVNYIDEGLGTYFSHVFDLPLQKNAFYIFVLQVNFDALMPRYREAFQPLPLLTSDGSLLVNQRRGPFWVSPTVSFLHSERTLSPSFPPTLTVTVCLMKRDNCPEHTCWSGGKRERLFYRPAVPLRAAVEEPWSVRLVCRGRGGGLPMLLGPITEEEARARSFLKQGNRRAVQISNSSRVKSVGAGRHRRLGCAW